MPRSSCRRWRLVTMALAVVLAGCSSEPRTGRTVEHATAKTGAEPSLFELTFPLTDRDGQVRHLDDFRGRPFVASMIYTQCTSVCPRVTADLQALERALPSGARSRVRFVLFSLDPVRDTPAALRAFAREHHLDPARWTLLAAAPDDMRTLAAVFDVRFRPDAGGEIAHSAVIVVVDRDGIVRHRQQGLANDRASLVTAVRTLE